MASHDQRLLRSSLVFSLGLHLVLIFGVLVSPASEEAIAAANRALTVLVTPATDAPSAALADAPAHQKGLAIALDGIATAEPSRLHQKPLTWSSGEQKTPLTVLQVGAPPQPQTAVAARAALEAEYVRRWQIAIEQFGNSQYRDAAKRHGNGDVRLRVRLDAEGGLRALEVLSTSGVAALDRAALDTVERLAPFSAFPPALANSVTELDIIRTWQFRY